jgi:hypothetical protein
MSSRWALQAKMDVKFGLGRSIFSAASLGWMEILDKCGEFKQKKTKFVQNS